MSGKLRAAASINAINLLLCPLTRRYSWTYLIFDKNNPLNLQKCLFIVHYFYIIICLSIKQLLQQILGRKHLMILIFLSSPTESSHHSCHLSWEIFRWNQLAARVLMLETTVPHFNLKVTKKQLQRKLGEYGPKKPRAVSTARGFCVCARAGKQMRGWLTEEETRTDCTPHLHYKAKLHTQKHTDYELKLG